MSENSSGLSKSLGLFKLTVYGVGTIVGSGVYSVIGPAAQAAGSSVWLSFVFAAISSMFSAFSYAELASAFPSAGGEYNFLNQAFPKRRVVGFLVGLFIAIHSSATLATVALTFAQYLNQFIKIDFKIIALILVASLSLVNIGGLKRAAWVNVSFTVLQILGLFTLIVAGLNTNFFSFLEKSTSIPIDLGKVLGGTSIIFFIYTGYEHLASMSEEVKDPEKNIWKAFVLALVISTIVYLGVIFSVLNLLGAEGLSKSMQPLAEAGRQKAAVLGAIISIAALLATANAVLSGSLSVSRLLFGMARGGEVPKSLMKINFQKSPWVAALVAMIASSIFILIGEIKFVASLSSLGALLVFASINYATIVLRFTKPKFKRPFKIPLAVFGVPVFPALGVCVSLLLALQYSLMVYVTFFSAVLLGIVVYKIRKRVKA